MERADDSELAERCEYVFGGMADPATWSEADEDERAGLVEKRFGARGDAHRAVRTVVVSQLLAGDPALTWATAQRLDGLGLDPDGVTDQLTMVLAQTLREVIGRLEATSDGPVGTVASEDGVPEATALLESTFAARLEQLPIPSLAEVEEALVAATADAAVIDAGELLALVQAGFDGWADDPLMTGIVQTALDDVLVDDGGPLVIVPDDGVAHADRLRDGIVLTHVLSGSERAVGVLAVSFDLAGFGRVPEPSIDGEALDLVTVEAGHLVWRGGDGWLARFEAGATLAVQVSPAGDVRIDPLPAAPTPDPELVATLLATYHRLADEPGLPVRGEDLIFGLAAAERGTFREPRAPLDALCEAAGLERRGSAVAHDPDLWANQSWLVRADRISAAAGGDDDLAEDVLTVLTLGDPEPPGGPGNPGDEDDRRNKARAAFEALDDIDVTNVVANELFDEDTWSERGAHAMAVVERLRGFARRPDERAAVHYLAARVAERESDLAEAERHLQQAVDADPDHVLAVDRLAWWASDRGDAARAVRLWRRCPPNRLVDVDLATVEPFAAARAEPNRNARCWCGSGRKYQQCHLGVAEQTALVDRVGWLHRKAAGYLDRSGPAARDAIVELVAGLVIDEDDHQVLRALEDPLVADLVLTEGGWFRRFLAERGPLLPDDEALLAASWTTIDRTVYEVVDADPGAGLVLRDLRTGDTLDVRERTFPTTATIGTLVCGRAVPDGETHQLVGAVRPVPAGREIELLALLDEGDPYAIATWFSALERPPALRTREGEPIVECEIVLTTGDPTALVAHLDASYDAAEAGAGEPSGSASVSASWIEHHDLDEDEAIVRAALRLDGDRLTITTNSEPRADRILRRLREDVEGVTVLDDTRTPLDPANPGAPTASGGQRHDADRSAPGPARHRRAAVGSRMAIPIPEDVRGILDRPNYVHLATLRKDGSPRSWVVWAGIEGERIFVCTDTGSLKAKDMQRDERVALSVVDIDDPYRMAAVQGRVVEVRPDPDNVHMDVLSYKYTSAPFPHRSPTRACFVIEVDHAGQRTLAFEHRPG